MKKKLLSIAICGMLAISLTACGSSGYRSAEKNSYDDSYYAGAEAAYDAAEPMMAEEYYEEDYLADGSDAGSIDTTTTENASTSNRKLIRTVGINAETKEFDKLVDNVTKKVQELGGYVENMDSYYGSKYNSVKSSKNATITARIPAKNLDAFLDMMGESSNITNKTENVEDVTLSYVDMASHKKMLEEERDRLLAFLDEATSIEEIITIEDRLSTVKYQIESMEAQLRTYDNKVDYSTVRITISEVVDFTEIKEPEPEKNAWQRMTEGFAESLENVLDGLKEFGIWFVINIPYLVIWAIIITVFVIVFRKVLKKFREKEKKRLEEKRANMQMAQTNPVMGRPQPGPGMPPVIPGKPIAPPTAPIPVPVTPVVATPVQASSENKPLDDRTANDKEADKATDKSADSIINTTEVNNIDNKAGKI